MCFKIPRLTVCLCSYTAKPNASDETVICILEHDVLDPLIALLFVVSAVAYRERHDNSQQQTDAGSQDFIFYVTVKDTLFCGVTPYRLVEIY